jgi:hypothetical protein
VSRPELGARPREGPKAELHRPHGPWQVGSEAPVEPRIFEINPGLHLHHDPVIYIRLPRAHQRHVRGDARAALARGHRPGSSSGSRLWPASKMPCGCSMCWPGRLGSAGQSNHSWTPVLGPLDRALPGALESPVRAWQDLCVETSACC